MYCEYCLKNHGINIDLIRFSDAYSCPNCYLVSNEIVFGKQTHNTIPFPSHDCGIYPYNELINKVNSEIENVCVFFNLTKNTIIKSNNIFLNLI